MNKIIKIALTIIVVYSLIFQIFTFFFSLLSLDRHTEINVVVFELLVPNFACVYALVYWLNAIWYKDKNT